MVTQSAKTVRTICKVFCLEKDISHSGEFRSTVILYLLDFLKSPCNIRVFSTTCLLTVLTSSSLSTRAGPNDVAIHAKRLGIPHKCPERFFHTQNDLNPNGMDLKETPDLLLHNSTRTCQVRSRSCTKSKKTKNGRHHVSDLKPSAAIEA